MSPHAATARPLARNSLPKGRRPDLAPLIREGHLGKHAFLIFAGILTYILFWLLIAVSFMGPGAVPITASGRSIFRCTTRTTPRPGWVVDRYIVNSVLGDGGDDLRRRDVREPRRLRLCPLPLPRQGGAVLADPARS